MIGRVALTMTRAVVARLAPLRVLYYGLRPLRVGLSSGRAMVRAGLGRLHP
jgi:hypothetical protein